MASHHIAPPGVQLVRPQLAKRTAYSAAQQHRHQPLAQPGTTDGAAVGGLGDALAASAGAADNGTSLAAQGKTAQQRPQLPAKPSLAKRKHAVDLSAAATASAQQLPTTPGMATRPSLAKRPPPAAKPATAKRRVGVFKPPALVTITEVSVSQPLLQAPALPAPPTELTTAAAPSSTLSLRQTGACAEEDGSSQPPATAKPAARQRIKAADLDAAEVHAKVVQKHAQGKLAELTVPEAKCWLKARKLPLKGKKEDLVARIVQALMPP